MRSRVRHPLCALLVAVFVVGVAWSVVTPPWQAPDENSHFGYVQYLSETGDLPGRRANAPAFSTEQRTAAEASNADLAAAQASIKMQWDTTAYEQWRDRQDDATAGQRSDGGGPNPAASNPPLYYLLQAPIYRLGAGADIFTRLQLLRISSLLWMLVAVACTWFLAAELFGRQPVLQLAAAGVVGLAPMMLFVSASVNPDAMLFAMWALVLWLGARLLRRGATVTTVAPFAAAIGAACVVKATSYALVPASAIATLVAIRRSAPSLSSRDLRTTLGAGVLGLSGTLGVWVLVARQSGHSAAAQLSVVSENNPIDVREFLSYLWQFYLPRTGVQGDFPSLAPTLPAWDFLVKGATASFGWTEVQFDAWVYWIALALGTLTICAALAGVWSDRARVDKAVALFFGLTVATLVLALHVSEYRQINAGALNFFQGRYLLPLAPLAGLAVARTLMWLPTPHRAPAVGLGLAGLLVFNVFCWALVLARFYA